MTRQGNRDQRSGASKTGQFVESLSREKAVFRLFHRETWNIILTEIEVVDSVRVSDFVEKHKHCYQTE